MDPERVFSIAGLLSMPGWLLLVFLPRLRWVTHLVAPVLIPAVLGIFYVVIFLSEIGSTEGGFDSLAGVGALFQNPWLLLAGWIHYLAFDLFVGAWEVRDAQRHGIHHLLVVPCLALTLLAGPTGLLVYLLLKAGLRRRVALRPTQEVTA